MAKVKDRRIVGTALYGVAGRKIHRAILRYRNDKLIGITVTCRDRGPSGHSFIRLGEGPAVTCLDCGPWRKGIEVDTEYEWETER